MTEALTISNTALEPAVAWMQERDSVLGQASAVEKVSSAEEFAAAGRLMTACKKLTNELDKYRREMTAPLDAVKKDIMAQQKQLAATLETQAARLRELCNAYATEQAAKRAAAERAAREAEAEAALAAQDAQALFGGAAAVPQLQPVVPDKLRADDVRTVSVINYQVTDPSLLDRKFLSPDDAKIRAFIASLRASETDPETVREPGLLIYKTVRVDAR